MSPKEAFDHTLQRARALQLLHDGLINTRQRGIRSDWKAAFCRLMHWPAQCDIARVDSSDAIIVLREGADLTADSFRRDAMDDLLRATLVMGVSALDRYVHERICKGIIEAFKYGTLLKEQQEFSIPLTLAMSATEALRKAQKQGRPIRPANEIRKKIQEMLHTRPFQSWREIEYAFRLIGVSGLAGKIQTQLGVPDIKPFQAQLSSIINRRHQIVHEGDLVRHQRGGLTRKNQIRPVFVRKAMNFLEDFVVELEKI